MSFFHYFCLLYETIPLFLSAISNQFIIKTYKVMTKADLIKKISEAANLTAADSKAALDATIDALKEALVAGDKVQLIGFGTFSVNERPAREGVNPANGQKIQIAAKKVAKFKAGADLEKQLNA